MDVKAFTQAYYESRNGANYFVRHWAARKFQFSDGVEQCAEAGCMWMIDIAATELPKLIAYGDMGSLLVKAHGGRAVMTLSLADDTPPAWKKDIDITDMPDGDWLFYIVNEGERFAMILPAEY
jgi:hypothetical protein